ncbi:abaA [Candida margitis]|uniref:abaA n=1 Tax=Candida margitis TaxID=1775924 RepID=UPI002225D38E|nr:abaA [Candida margitis]KAI5961752.1 abaA [Candida margitis]
MTNPPSIVLEPAPPETPRSKSAQSISQGSNRLSTPSFLFGLSFSPTFHFNTPSGISPSRLFSPAKASGRPHVDKNATQLTSKDHNKFLASLNSISQATDAGRQKSCSNLKVNAEEKEEEEEDDGEEEKEEDVWSSMNITQQSQSNLTSIHESDKDICSFDLDGSKFDHFLTPDKVFDHKSNESLAKSGSDVSSQISPARSGSSISSSDLSTKRRKLSGITDTPNNRIANKIDSTMDSPVSVRRLSNANSAASSSASEVWSRELDDVLIKSFHKYQKFKSSESSNELSILKKTSQNKVISRMIFNRTGVLRTSKQISSRIFRLSKAGKLTKETKTPQTNASTSELEEMILTPLEDLVNSQQLPESAHTDALIDRELDILLTSSPLDDVFDAKTKYMLTPKDFKMCFHDHRQSVIFTRLKKQMRSDNKVLDKFGSLIPYTINSRKIPVWVFQHDLDLRIADVATSTPSSQSCSPNFANVMSLSHSQFESIMSIDVYCDGRYTPSMLTWYSSIEVYKDGKKLLSAVDIVSGYCSEDSRSYTLRVPFVKTFFAGYFNYLINGSAIGSGEDIKIVQFIYNNADESNSQLDLEKSHFHACMVHDFHVTGTRGETVVTIVDSRNVPPVAESDDNETVIAESSPCRPSNTPQPSTRNRETPSKLKIDINRANVNHNIPSGPMTAPIYNSSLVNELNRNTLGALEKQNRFTHAQLVQPPPEQQQTDQFAMYRKQLQYSFDSSPDIRSNINDTVDIESMGNVSLGKFHSRAQQGNMPNVAIHDNQYRVPNNGLQAQAVAARAHLDSHVRSQAQQSYPQQFYQFPQQQMPQMATQFLQNDPLGIPIPSVGRPANIQIMSQHQNASTPSQFHLQPGQPRCSHLIPNTNTNTTKYRPKQHSRTHLAHSNGDKENKTKEITFGPILGYDPSKDAKITRAQTKPTNQAKGVHTFPLNEPVMYKPKK